MSTVVVRPGSREDAGDFGSLMVLSGPAYYRYVYGPDAAGVLAGVFVQGGNLFSFQHTLFAQERGEVLGMILGYGWEDQQAKEGLTMRLLFQSLGWRLPIYYWRIRRTETVLGLVQPGEFMAANLAVYPQARGKGVGKQLLRALEQRAREQGMERLVLDVLPENQGARELYQRLGFRVEGESPRVRMGSREVYYLRMALPLHQEESQP